MKILTKLLYKKEVSDPQRVKWLSELSEVKKALESNDMLFNITDDFNLIEYAIHKKSALEARYSYLMRLIRKYDEQKNNEYCIESDNENILYHDIEVNDENAESLQR